MDTGEINPAFCKRILQGSIWRRTCWNFRNTWIFFLTPILLLPLPLSIHTQEAKCGYVLILMVVYFLTEVVPIPIVSLMPLVLLPALEIIKPKDLSIMYMKEIAVSFLGAVMIAISLQRWGIPRRLALWALIKVGSDIRWLLFALMSTTSFLSLWINNSPTAIMMLPIAQSVVTEYLKQLTVNEHIPKKRREGNGEVTVSTILKEDIVEMVEVGQTEAAKNDNPTDETNELMSEEKRNVLKLFVLCVPWSCNFGGAASLYGTGGNLLLKATLENEFQEPITITFVNWAAFSLPCSLIMLVIGWAWLQIYHLGWRRFFTCRRKTPELLQREAAIKNVFQKEYEKLGPMSFAEYAVVGHMTTLALLWITMDPGVFTGWESLFSKGFASAYLPAILLTISLFVFPSKFPNFLRFWNKEELLKPYTPAPALMDWKTLCALLPWNTLLILGGGLAIAEGIKVSGLSVWVAGNLNLLRGLPPFAVSMLCVLFATFITECMSNGALLSIFLPILANLAVTLHIHPLYLMFPVSIGTTYSFMLPTASATNAMAYSVGVLNIKDMFKPGIIINLIGVLVITLAANTWGAALFNLHTYPSWAERNSTMSNTTVL